MISPISPLICYFILSHFQRSLNVVFLPNIRIPILYIFADTHAQAINVSARRTIESTSSHVGTPYGIRASITIGDVKGIIDPQNTNGLSGARNAYKAIKNARSSGKVTGI